MQDLETRTSQEPPTRAFVQAHVRHGFRKTFMQGFLSEDLPRGFYAKIFAQGPVQDYARQHSTKISTKSSHRGLYKIMPGTSETISAGSPQDLLRRTCARKDFTPQDLRVRSCTRFCKEFLERILPGSPQDLRIRSCAGLCKILPGSPQDLLTRTCTRSCKGLL